MKKPFDILNKPRSWVPQENLEDRKRMSNGELEEMVWNGEARVSLYHNPKIAFVETGREVYHAANDGYYKINRKEFLSIMKIYSLFGI